MNPLIHWRYDSSVRRARWRYRITSRHGSMNRSFGFGPSPSQGGRGDPWDGEIELGCIFPLAKRGKSLTISIKKMELGCNRPR
jgi:hypothetical protein